MSVDTFKSQNRGGKGIKGMQTLDDDYIEELFMTNTHHYVMFFTNTGRDVYKRQPSLLPNLRGKSIIHCSYTEVLDWGKLT